MFKRIALISALAVSGSLSFGASVHAADNMSEPIIFNGSVAFQCLFQPPTPGTVVPVGFPATILSSTEPGGVSGTVEVSCNGAADFLKEAAQTGGPALPSPVDFSITVSPDGVAAGATETLNVDLVVDNQDIIEPGDYVFTVTLTAVPD